VPGAKKQIASRPKKGGCVAKKFGKRDSRTTDGRH
jgi:hypothetical protein